MKIKTIKTRKHGENWFAIDVVLLGATGKELELTPFGVWKEYDKTKKRYVYESDTHSITFNTLQEAKNYARKVLSETLFKTMYE